MHKNEMREIQRKKKDQAKVESENSCCEMPFIKKLVEFPHSHPFISRQVEAWQQKATKAVAAAVGS